jgi:hypothetical protein
MLGGMREIFVCREQYHIVPDTKLRKQGINSAKLNARSAASITQGCCVDVIIPIGLEEWQGSKSFDNLSLRLGAEEALQKFLQNQPGSNNDF